MNFRLAGIVNDLASVAHVVLVGLLLVAALAKMTDRRRSKAFLCSLGFSSNAATKAGIALVVAELVTVALLLFGSPTLGGLAVGCLFGLFFVALVAAKRAEEGSVPEYFRRLFPRYWFDSDSLPPGTAGLSLRLPPIRRTR